MSMNYQEVSRRLPEGIAVQYAEGIEQINELAARLQREGKLPDRFPETNASKVDLRLQTLDLLAVNTFREPTAEEKRLLAQRGYDIFLPTKAETLYAVVALNPDYFWDSKLHYVNDRPKLRDFVPPALTVALRSQQLFLEGSFSKSQGVQLRMTEAESQAVRQLVPAARAIMLPASTDAQLDLEYFEKTNQVLFTNRFARALDKTSDVRVARVGRYLSDSRLHVYEWSRGYGYVILGALSAVVFLENR